MLAALASALAAREPSTAAHCTRVTLLAERVAVWLGWDERRLRALRLGGPVHDLGKVMISPENLRKRGPLEPAEIAEIQKHPAAGARLIGPIWPAQEALPFVLYHHERWDGTGYPTGRSGIDIPEEARVLAVADAFDAMTSMRPYRRAFPVSTAVTEIERCAGSQFDPMVANAFLQCWHAGALQHAVAV